LDINFGVQKYVNYTKIVALIAPTAPPLSTIDEQLYGPDTYQQPPQNAPRATTATYTTATEETVIT